MDKKQENHKGKQFRKYAALSGVAFQMGATIFLCAYAGKKLDAYYNLEKQWFTMGMVLFGLISSIYIVIKQLERINRSDK